MKTFARISSGTATDVCFGSSVAVAVGQSFAAGYVDGFGLSAWTEVPAGTQAGATTSDGKTFVNPAAVAQAASAPDPLTTLTATVASLQDQMGQVLATLTTLQAAVVTAVPAAADAVQAAQADMTASLQR